MFCSTGCKRLVRKNTPDVCSCLKYQRSRGISRERWGAVAFPVLCCRGLWDLASSEVESFQCWNESGKEHVSEAQDRANISIALCPVCMRVCVVSTWNQSPSVRLEWCVPSHLSVGTAYAAPAYPLCVKSQASEDTDCPVTGRQLQSPFHGITRERTKMCCGYGLVWGMHLLCLCCKAFHTKEYCLLDLKVMKLLCVWCALLTRRIKLPKMRKKCKMSTTKKSENE